MSLNKVAFITGGAGFIGSRLANKLCETREVIVYDNLHPQIHSNGELKEGTLSSKVHFVKGDVCDRGMLEHTLREFSPEVIFHLASETGTGQSQDEIARYTNVNVQGTAILLESIRSSALKNMEQLILSSSRAVYGECAYFDETLNRIVPGSRRETARMANGDFYVYNSSGQRLSPRKTQENLAPNPMSVYAATKLMQEYLVNQAALQHKWKSVNLRFQNVYGAGQSLNNPYTGVLSIFSGLLSSGEKLNIFEDGQISRDFIYVDDVVEALAVASTTQNIESGKIINIGSGEELSILDTARVLASLFNAGENSLYISGDYRIGDIRYSVADISLAKALLNWSPRISIHEGLKRLSNWVKGELG